MKKKQAWKVMGAVLAGTLVFSDAVPLRASASAGTEKSAVQNETVSGTENGTETKRAAVYVNLKTGDDTAGRGVNTAETAATIATGKLGIFHGMKSYFCQDEYGQIAPVYSISAGLDYPGIGPEHAHLYDTGRAEYVPVTDEEAVEAFEYLSRTEGIIPAIESAHAVAYAKKIVPQMRKDQIVVITISGRGDKDCAAIARYRGEDIHE